MSAIEKIEAQQKNEKEFSRVWAVGEQLKEICSDPACAKLVDADLDNPQMSLIECEKKIRAYANKHREGSFACVVPQMAEKIIRDFYGLPQPGAGPAPSPKAEIIDLGDFL